MTTSHKSAGGGTSSGNAVQTGSEPKHAPFAGASASPSVSVASRPQRRPPRLVVSRRSTLSFRTETWTARGRLVSLNDFDVPLEDHREGWLRGIRAAGELLHELQTGATHSLHVEHIIKHACEGLACPGKEKSRRPAAYAFIRVLSDMVSFAAQHADHRRHVAAHIESTLAEHAFLDAHAEQLRQDFIARMKAGKVAKKEAALLLARLQENGHA